MTSVLANPVVSGTTAPGPAEDRRARLGKNGRFDAVSALSFFIFTLIAIPSALIVGPLGAAGTPAEIVGMVLFPAWGICVFSSAYRRSLPRQPIRLVMWIFAGAIILSYIAANLRTMMPDESRAADRGLLLLASWLGITFMSMDVIPSRDRLDVLLRRFVFAAGALATLGVIQYLTKQAWTNYIEIPGLTANTDLIAIYGRDGLARPSGTAVHPIEFGAVLTMALPIALHYAFSDRDRPLLRRWYPVLAIAMAVPISISRSAILSSIVVLCFLIPSWPVTIRRRSYAAIVMLGGIMYVLAPGLIGTLTSLFTGLSGDSSTTSRAGSFPLAFQFFQRAPLFGRGFQTFLPAYRIFDDQYLGLLVETGILGLVAFLALVSTGVLGGISIRRHGRRATDRSLGLALAASCASALASFALFDGFGFPMAASTIFLLLGCLGALYRFVILAESVSNTR